MAKVNQKMETAFGNRLEALEQQVEMLTEGHHTLNVGQQELKQQIENLTGITASLEGSLMRRFEEMMRQYDGQLMDEEELNLMRAEPVWQGFTVAKNHVDGGFSFPTPRDGQLVQISSGKSLWSNQGNIVSKEADDCGLPNEDMLAPWRHKRNESSPVISSRDENNATAGESANSSPSSLSNYGKQHGKKEEDVIAAGVREEDPGASFEDEEAAAVQEQIKHIKAQEEEFETFELRIVQRKNRTGFEEDKNSHVVLNSVTAGRYHVTEYLGSAAFSKAIQAHDLHTGMDFCLKIKEDVTRKLQQGRRLRGKISKPSPTVEDFWSVYDNIHHPSKLTVGADFLCFTNKIEPKWEDPVCANGGEWIVSFSRGKADTSWLYTLLAMIGEPFDPGGNLMAMWSSLNPLVLKLTLMEWIARISFSTRYGEFHYHLEPIPELELEDKLEKRRE